jgi:hypothetical protein
MRTSVHARLGPLDGHVEAANSLSVCRAPLVLNVVFPKAATPSDLPASPFPQKAVVVLCFGLSDNRCGTRDEEDPSKSFVAYGSPASLRKVPVTMEVHHSESSGPPWTGYPWGQKGLRGPMDRSTLTKRIIPLIWLWCLPPRVRQKTSFDMRPPPLWCRPRSWVAVL